MRFLKQFIGFIFEDHLENDITSYKEKQKYIGRIIASDFEQKQINLSLKKCHIELKKYSQLTYKAGDIFQEGFTVKKVLYGGSYLVNINSKNLIKNCFLHQNHIDL